ncbi:MAG: glutamine-hydrolyzing GMP synthase [Candidatus Bathyarchaeota archaeon]|nr:MAG: glutamine-hydrolyzing GMP synthase [Candidatus Bathyarchaeota archaeon]
MKPDTVLVLDFGGQYCHLIARRIRENKVYSEIVSSEISPAEIKRWQKKLDVKGLILSGGPQSVFEPTALKINPEILDFNLPVLGLCYGHQIIALTVGGTVKPSEKKEFGVAYATIDKPVGVLKGLENQEKVWMSHSDTVFDLPKQHEILAHTDNCPIAAFRLGNHPIYGLQWHPEVVHTEHGNKMLKNFLFDVCGCQPNWTMDDFLEKSADEILSAVGDEKVIVALSGGIDSSTATAIAARAIGKNLTAVFVDHGFMREDEPKFVKDTFENFDMHFVAVNAQQRFLQRLQNITDPEKKRTIIGEEFVRVFEEEARKVNANYLLQGTIYPDRIESGFRKFSDKIKSHHNVAGLPTKIEFKSVVEPLKDLYKDEVREVAKKLGLPKAIVTRQPFPGPGLAVRVTGAITEAKLSILRKADKIVTEEIEKVGLAGELWQYFAVLSNTKSTGIKGDSRAYGHMIALRIVESREAMTASFAKIPYDILEKISSRIVNEIPAVTRVVYDITHKPPATIEWE